MAIHPPHKNFGRNKYRGKWHFIFRVLGCQDWENQLFFEGKLWLGWNIRQTCQIVKCLKGNNRTLLPHARLFLVLINVRSASFIRKWHSFMLFIIFSFNIFPLYFTISNLRTFISTVWYSSILFTSFNVWRNMGDYRK